MSQPGTDSEADHLQETANPGSLVKWLYPAHLLNMDNNEGSTARQEAFENDKNIAMSTRAAEGGIMDAAASPTTTSGPDSDIASVEELNPGSIDDEDDEDDDGQADVTEEISSKVTAGANYLGSIFSSAWSKTAKTANEATSGSSAFLSSALTKVTGKLSGKEAGGDQDPGGLQPDLLAEATKASAEPEGPEPAAPDQEADQSKQEQHQSAPSAFFSAAWSKMEGLTKWSSVAQEVTDEKGLEEDKEAKGVVEETLQQAPPEAESQGSSRFFSSFSNMVNKVAVDATSAFKDKVGNASMISEFNREQEEFIKSRADAEASNNHGDVPLPWVGHGDEKGLKAKILALSEDKRTFVRAPASGLAFEFDYASISSVAMALLEADPTLAKMRYALVPKVVKEDEFWRNYFYRVNLIKESFDLEDIQDPEVGAGDMPKEDRLAMPDDEVHHQQEGQGAADIDDEFVSEAYQASLKDEAEVNESMKRLGVGGNQQASDMEQWEAELEGELNEFEVVSSKDAKEVVVGSSSSAEWENQIQEMLDAEDNH